MGVIAAMGWGIDASVYLAVATLTGHVFLANMLGNCCGIAFSFIFGSRHAFHYRGQFSWRPFIAYAAFSLTLMPLFSWIIAWLVHGGALGLLPAKILVTVPSFLCNYLFLRWLIKTSMGKTSP